MLIHCTRLSSFTDSQRNTVAEGHPKRVLRQGERKPNERERERETRIKEVARPKDRILYGDCGALRAAAATARATKRRVEGLLKATVVYS